MSADCQHIELKFRQSWDGTDDCGAWVTTVYCPECERDGFTEEELNTNYRCLKRSEIHLLPHE